MALYTPMGVCALATSAKSGVLMPTYTPQLRGLRRLCRCQVTSGCAVKEPRCVRQAWQNKEHGVGAGVFKEEMQQATLACSASAAQSRRSLCWGSCSVQLARAGASFQGPGQQASALMKKTRTGAEERRLTIMDASGRESRKAGASKLVASAPWSEEAKRRDV